LSAGTIHHSETLHSCIIQGKSRHAFLNTAWRYCQYVVPVSEHAVELGLREPQPAMNEIADLLTSANFLITADVDADQPCAGPAVSDLVNIKDHIPS
jgi:hypothetical protein